MSLANQHCCSHQPYLRLSGNGPDLFPLDSESCSDSVAPCDRGPSHLPFGGWRLQFSRHNPAPAILDREAHRGRRTGFDVRIVTGSGKVKIPAVGIVRGFRQKKSSS